MELCESQARVAQESHSVIRRQAANPQWVTVGETASMGQIRRGGPGSKTKGGCVTCKQRRVKCDETKPICVRCQRLSIQCDGYGTTWEPSKRSIKRLWPLDRPDPPLLAIATRLIRTPTQVSFSDDEESRYFQLFCNTTASNLGEYLDSSLWTHIVLQASEQEFFIKHAVIALGALNKAVDETTATKDFVGRALASGSTHHHAALSQYGKAISGIRKACAEKRRSMRTILIACLLAICFEYLHGNIDSAIAHSRNGSKLLDEWFRSIKELAQLGNEQHFLPGIIEDELISIFTRMNVDIFSWGWEVERVSMHPDLRGKAFGIMKSIPIKCFANFHSAKKFFDIIAKQVDWVIGSVDNRLWTRLDAPVESKPVTQGDDSFEDLDIHQQQEAVDSLKEGLRRWRTTFHPLHMQSVRSGGDSALAATALLLCHTYNIIALNCCFDGELSYDAYTLAFRYALFLADNLAASTSSKGRPTFIISSILIKNLYWVAIKCRVIPLRKRAIVYLRSLSRREGIWDSRVAATVATVVTELEESDANGFVPEHRRLRAIKTSFNLHDRRGRLRYLLGETGSGAAGLVAHQREFSW